MKITTGFLSVAILGGVCSGFIGATSEAQASTSLSAANVTDGSGRAQMLLSDADWLFFGADSNLPYIGSHEFGSAPWQIVTVPHVFQSRAHFADIMQGWYRRDFTVPPE